MSNMEITENQVGLRIKVLRKAYGMSQYQLANKMDTSECAVKCWEKGRNRPNLKNARRLSEIFRVPEGFILYGEQ